MIATLGIMQVARGLDLTIAQGRTVSGFKPFFRSIGVATVPGTTIPIQIVLMIGLYILVFYLLRYRKFGRFIYSIGGNEEATRLSGVNVDRYKILAYVLSGVTAAIAAIVMTAKLNSAVPTAGKDMSSTPSHPVLLEASVSPAVWEASGDIDGRHDHRRH